MSSATVLYLVIFSTISLLIQHKSFRASLLVLTALIDVANLCGRFVRVADIQLDL